MTAIIQKQNFSFGAIFIDWLAKWIEDFGKKKALDKPAPKMFHRRLISIILKKRLKERITDKEGEALNANKKITPKLFENWKRNPLENLRSKQSEGGSEKTISEVQKPVKAKGKRKIQQIAEEA